MNENNIISARIEMVSGSNIKHIYIESTGEIKVQRELPVALPKPFNYGFVPDTKSDGSDELDVFVLSNRKMNVGDLVNSRPIGALLMEDEDGLDNKIISVDDLDANYKGMKELGDVNKALIDMIVYYVQHNKDGIEGKFVKIHGLGDSDKALELLEAAKE